MSSDMAESAGQELERSSEHLPTFITTETNFGQLAQATLEMAKKRTGLDLDINRLAENPPHNMYAYKDEAIPVVAQTPDGQWTVQAYTDKVSPDSTFGENDTVVVLFTKRDSPDQDPTTLKIQQSGNRGMISYAGPGGRLVLGNCDQRRIYDDANIGQRDFSRQTYHLEGDFPDAPRQAHKKLLQGAIDTTTDLIMKLPSKTVDGLYQKMALVDKHIRPVKQAVWADEFSRVLESAINSLPTSAQLQPSPDYPYRPIKELTPEQESELKKLQQLFTPENYAGGFYAMSDDFVPHTGADFTPCAQNPLLHRAVGAILHTDQGLHWQGQATENPSVTVDFRSSTWMGDEPMRRLNATASITAENSEDGKLAHNLLKKLEQEYGNQTNVMAEGGGQTIAIPFEEDKYGYTGVFTVQIAEDQIRLEGFINNAHSGEVPKFLEKFFGILTTVNPNTETQPTPAL